MKPFTRFNDQWNPDYFDLSGFAKSIHSQNNEDGIIEAIFKVCGYDTKYCVDIGSTDGVWCSNVRNLIVNYGWSALMIEWEGILRGKKAFPLLQENYKNNSNVITFHEFVTKDNIEEILNRFYVPKNFDLLNIDIDSKDLEVWEGVKYRRPNLVVIECNCDRTNLNEFYYNPGDSKGAASVGSLYKVAREKGYDYLCVEMCNAFFIEKNFGRKLLR